MTIELLLHAAIVWCVIDHHWRKHVQALDKPL